MSEASKTKRKERSKKLQLRFKGGSHKSILFTDEKIFTVEQSLNKQNGRVYATSQPYVAVQHTGYPKSIMVFASITSDGKTPLIFVPQGIKVNGNNYLDMLKTEIVPWAKKHFKKPVLSTGWLKPVASFISRPQFNGLLGIEYSRIEGLLKSPS